MRVEVDAARMEMEWEATYWLKGVDARNKEGETQQRGETPSTEVTRQCRIEQNERAGVIIEGLGWSSYRNDTQRVDGSRCGGRCMSRSIDVGI